MIAEEPGPDRFRKLAANDDLALAAGMRPVHIGRDWIGIHRTDRYLVTGATQQPLLPALLALLLLLGTLGFAWYREGR